MTMPKASPHMREHADADVHAQADTTIANAKPFDAAKHASDKVSQEWRQSGDTQPLHLKSTRMQLLLSSMTSKMAMHGTPRKGFEEFQLHFFTVHAVSQHLIGHLC